MPSHAARSRRCCAIPCASRTGLTRSSGSPRADMPMGTVVVTGASSGIGAAAAVELSPLGAAVVPIGRDRDRLETVAEDVREVATGGTAQPLRADFASLDEVRRLASELLERHERIDVLVNNAGLIMGRRTLSADGYEMTLAVN